MTAGIKTPVHELSRESLEALARRALAEAHELRQQIAPNGLFNAVAAGFVLGAFVATAGFLIGAAIR
jgi:hypothetical protein